MRLYTDFSQPVFEIIHSHYSMNSFRNAGLRYNFYPCWIISTDLSNLLNCKDYKVSFYQRANFQYYKMPLRGREFFVSLRLNIEKKYYKIALISDFDSSRSNSSTSIHEGLCLNL